MKIKHILILFLIGIIVSLIGMQFKIMHWPGADKLLLSSSVIKAIALILAIWKVLTVEKFRDFLNSENI